MRYRNIGLIFAIFHEKSVTFMNLCLFQRVNWCNEIVEFKSAIILIWIFFAFVFCFLFWKMQFSWWNLVEISPNGWMIGSRLIRLLNLLCSMTGFETQTTRLIHLLIHIYTEHINVNVAIAWCEKWLNVRERHGVHLLSTYKYIQFGE